MSSHLLSVCTDFYGMRPVRRVRYRFDHFSKIVEGPFWGGRRCATEHPNDAKLCRHVEESLMNTHRYFWPNLRLYAFYTLGLRPPEWRGMLTIYHTSWFARPNLGIRTTGDIHWHPWRRPAVYSAASGLGVDTYYDMYNEIYNDQNNELETTITITIHKTICNHKLQ